MYILQQLCLTNSLSTACLGQVIIKIMQLKILLQVQWTHLVVTGLRNHHCSDSKPVAECHKVECKNCSVQNILIQTNRNWITGAIQ